MTAERVPTVVPMLAYEDAAGAIDFLTRAFGFVERFRLPDDEGGIGHAELALDDGLIMLTDFKYGYQGPAHHAQTCETSRGWLDNPYVVNGVYIQVDDIHAHFDQAKSAGATILSEVEDTGHGPLYRAADPEGQRWMFAQRQSTR